MSNGNYFFSVQDLAVSKTSLFNGIELSYNSGSAKKGILGEGWCASWEHSLKKDSKGFVFTHCGQGQTTSFHQKYKKAFCIDKSKTDCVSTTGRSNTVARTKEGKVYQVFERGRLVQQVTPWGSQHLKYHKTGRLLQIGRKAAVRFQYDSKGQLAQIISGKKQMKIKYRASHPVEIEKSDGTKFSFSYHSNGQLKSLSRNKTSLGTLEYRQGRVSRFLPSRSCQETYHYSDKKKYKSSHRKVYCDGQMISQNKLEQWYRLKNKEMQLTKKQMTTNGKKRIEVYSGNRISQIQDSDGKTNFGYDKKGRLILVKAPKITKSLTFDEEGRVKTYFEKEKGKKSFRLKYKYDRSGQVSRVIGNSSVVVKSLEYNVPIGNRVRGIASSTKSWFEFQDCNPSSLKGEVRTEDSTKGLNYSPLKCSINVDLSPVNRNQKS